MPSLQQLLTKKSDAGPVAAPLWHPNFRNYERLPDTKVVRTAFFINAVAGTVALLLLFYVGFREFLIYNLDQQIADSQQQIDSKTGQNAEALRLTKTFADEERKVQEALAFSEIAIEPSQFLILLGRTLPREIAIEFVDMRFAASGGPVVVLRGLAAGSPEEASGAASSYADVFRTNAEFIAAIEQADITNVNRDASRGIITFEVVLKLKTPGKEKKS